MGLTTKLVKKILGKKDKDTGGGIAGKLKKKVKRRIIIIVVIIAIIVVGILIAMVVSSINSLIKRAALAGQSNGEWIIDDAGNRGVNIYETGEVADINGGLSGFGIDINTALLNSTDSEMKKTRLQVAQLYDIASLEMKAPGTLLGLALLTKECDFWYLSNGDILDSTQNDIYKYRMSGDRIKVPPSQRGGGKLWHVASQSEVSGITVYSAEHELNAGSGASPDVGNLKYGTTGYFNHGAYGIVQVEGDIWVSNAWTWAGISDVSSGKSHVAQLRDHEEFTNRIMGLVGHPNYLSEFQGEAYASYEDYVTDLGNLSTNVLATLTYFGKNYPIVACNLGEKQYSALGNIAKYAGDAWETMTEQERNVYTVICWLQIWNGGEGSLISSDTTATGGQIRWKLMVDLSKYLVHKGADGLREAGWTGVSNAANTALGEDSKKSLDSHFKALTNTLYGTGSTEAINAYNELVRAYINGGIDTSYSSYLYSLDGIIRAQASANIIAIDAGYSQPFNVYQAKYSSSSNNERRNTIKLVENVTAYMLTQLGLTYSQEKRMDEGFYDCSSFVARSFRECGFNSFCTTGGPAKTAASIANFCYDNGGTVIYEAELVYNAEKRDGYNSGYGMIPEIVENGIDFSKLMPGDLIFWDYDTAGDNDRFMWIDHVAMYIGDGKIAEAIDSGTRVYDGIYYKTAVALIIRLNDGVPGVPVDYGTTTE